MGRIVHMVLTFFNMHNLHIVNRVTWPLLIQSV